MLRNRNLSHIRYLVVKGVEQKGINNNVKSPVITTQIRDRKTDTHQERQKLHNAISEKKSLP